MHPFGRFPEASLKDLVRTAVVRALDDAGLGTKDIQAAYSSNGMAGLLQGQEQIRGQSVLREVGIEGIPIVNVENACAGGSTAFREAVIAVQAGVVDTALAVGFEKMFVEDRDRTLAALESAADLDVVSGLGLQFTAVYALRLRKRLDEGSLTVDDCVQAAVKSHHNGSLNPNAQHRKEVTPEQVLASRPIAEPLTLLDLRRRRSRRGHSVGQGPDGASPGHGARVGRGLRYQLVRQSPADIGRTLRPQRL
jgi:acetyl-CoA acetyltransferase